MTSFVTSTPALSSTSRAYKPMCEYSNVDIRTRANILFLLVLLVPFIEPQLFKLSGFETVDQIFSLGKLASAFLIVILYMGCKPSKIVVLMSLCQIWILVSTVANDGSLTRYAGPAITSVAMLMVGELAIKLDGLYFCKIIRNYLSALFAINLLTCVGIGLGLITHAALFGMDNRWIYMLLPWVALSFIVDTATKGKPGIYSRATLLFSIVSLITLWSVGAMLTMTLWPIAWLLYGRKILSRIRLNTATSLLVVFLAVQVLLIGGFLLPYLGEFIREYLHKDTTLAGRTYLWAAVLDVLHQNPLFGAGVQTHEHDMSFFFSQSGNVIGTMVNHPHNYLLNVAYHGGYIAASLFLLIHFIVCKRIDASGNAILSRCMYCFMACYLFASLVDTLDFSLMYLLLALPWWRLSEKEPGTIPSQLIRSRNEIVTGQTASNRASESEF